MAEGRRGLGRGLSALLDEVAAASTPEGRRASGALDLPIELIDRNPDQPRRAFPPEALEELTESIRERGVIQPILVRPMAGSQGRYQIVAGERRWRAAQGAGLRVIPALVRDLTPLEVMEFALIENIQRADLNPLEEARGYEAIAEKFKHGADAIAKVVGKSRSHVINTIRLMRLPESVREHLQEGRLTAGHARALLDVPEAQALADRIIRLGLNVRQTEALARRAKQEAAPNGARPPRRAAAKDADTRALEADLEDVLGMTVTIRDAGGAGELRIGYDSLEQLDDLCRRLTRAPARG